ncbi:MAG: PAS domain-containing protein [Proteobacteria bacterium]|nr:PAS domain-containing protein [Pseudomonadota bacterium]
MEHLLLTSDLAKMLVVFAALSLVASIMCLVLGLKYRKLEKSIKSPQIGKESQAGILNETAFFYKNAINGREISSQALVRLLKLPDSTTSIDKLPTYFNEDDAAKFKKGLSTLSEGKRIFSVMLDGSKGQYPPMLCVGKRFDEEPGELKAIMIYFYDIPELVSQMDVIRNEGEEASERYKALRVIFDSCPSPAWQRNSKLEIVDYNESYAKVIGKENIKPKEPVPELHSNIKKLAEQAVKNKTPEKTRQHIVSEGERKFYECTEVPTADGGTCGYSRDVSELEVLQNELQNYIEAQDHLMESSASATVIYGTDMRINFFNNAFMNLWQLEDSWLTSKPTYGEILGKLREQRMLPEQADFQAYKKKQLELFTSVIDSYEEFMYLPDGKVLRVIVIPYALGGLLFSYEDMTEKVTLERKYNTEIAVKKATIDNLNEGVAVIAEDGRVKLFNPVFANMWQLDPAMLEKMPHISEVLDQTKFYYDYGEDWNTFRQQTIAGYFKRHTQVRRIERTDGSVIEWGGVPLPDGATLMTYQDITDSTLVERSLRAEREALKEADSLKSNFLSNVSYELRSPLTSIKGFSEVLSKGYFGALNEKQKDYVEGIFNSSLMLNALINDILDIASIDAGYMTLDVKEFDLKKALEEVTPMLKEKMDHEKVKFYFESSKDIGKILGDEKRIGQITVNLVNNALRFTKEGDSVSLKIGTLEQDRVFISVKNTGKGIPASELPHIFEKFYKTQRTENDSKHIGTALALPVVKSFIDLHGGRIDIVSDSDKGMEITCTLHRFNKELLKSKSSGAKKKKAAAS